MKNKITVIIIALSLALIIALAVIVYPKLKNKVADDETEGTAETTADTAAGFTVYDGDGNKISLGDYLGKKPVVVNFWASWCPPCKEELPYFDDAYKKYGGEAEFLMINCTDGTRDTVEGIKDFIAENGYSFPVCYDVDYSASEAYAVNYIPVTLFIDRSGALVEQHVGAYDAAALDSQIQKILK